MMNRSVYIISAIFLISILVFLFFHKSEKIISVEMGGKAFSVEVVQTDTELERGLSGHALLRDNQGMFFIFPKPDKYGFWMKDMLFPIDIIWIDSNFKIVHMENSVLPETYPKVFYPENPSLYVLEVSSGQAEILGLEVGDAVKFIKK